MSGQFSQDGGQSAESRFWRVAWRIAVAVFIGLVVACGYWIARLGFFEALAQPRFQWLAFAGVFTGIVLLARYAVGMFTAGFAFDRRNMALRGRSLGNWFVPRTRDDDGKS